MFLDHDRLRIDTVNSYLLDELPNELFEKSIFTLLGGLGRVKVFE
jgi:hypothetical protein